MRDKSLRQRVARWLGPGTERSSGAVASPGTGFGAGTAAGPAMGHGVVPGGTPGAGHGSDSRPVSSQPPLPARPAEPAAARRAEVWPGICERFALQMLEHAENLRPALDRLEADEDDEERLQWLYQVDHSITRMRRAARDLRVLAGVEEGDLGGYTSTLVDVIRAAESSIEHYPKVIVGKVADLAVVPYASDDFSSLLAALLDNATSYSPSTVTVSGHLLETGSVMLRIEDNGIGISPAHIQTINAALAGPIPPVDERTGRHTGFPVVHRLARKHGVGVRLASRTHPGTGVSSGTIAMVTIPPDLLCEVPDERPPVGRPADESPAPLSGPYAGGGSAPRLSVADPSRVGEPTAPTWRAPDAGTEHSTVSGLPRRTRTSLRGDGGRGHAHGVRRDEDRVAAARSFADDLTAFTSGDQTGGPGTAGDRWDRPEGEGR